MILIPIFRGKGDVRSCGSCRSIKLLEHGMKVVDFERRLRKIVKLDEMQNGFMPRRGTIDAVFIVRQLMEKYETAGRNLFMVFVDLEKTFDRVPREVIRCLLRRKEVLEREVKAIMEMYDNIKTSVNMDCMRSESFEVKVGVHQKSILSLLLFAIVMDEVTRDTREGVVKDLLYADDLILIGNSWEEVESRYARWKKALKKLKINVNKTKRFYAGGKVARMQTQKFRSSVCGNGVGRNSLQCTKCQYWVHEKFKESLQAYMVLSVKDA